LKSFKNLAAMRIHSFVFSPFQENTYLLIDDANNCAIVDPGCYTSTEQQELRNYITENDLKPILLLQTHCHIDHIFGTKFACDTWNLTPIMHKEDLPWMENAEQAAGRWELNINQPDIPTDGFLEHGDIIKVGNTEWEVRFTPGHAPGHVVFIHHASKNVIAGDTLFRESVGRTDLPLCNHEDLMTSINTQLLTLDDDYTVHSGHGPTTTIGHERNHNPFL
jgi:hydroxyacylglutathione hydrolase